VSDLLRILHVERSETDAALVASAVRDAGRMAYVERVESPEAMRAALLKRGWDVVLSDGSTGPFGALAALAVLKEVGHDIPLIVVSGAVGEEPVAEALRAGARDFLLKEHIDRLVPAIEREMRERTAREEQRRARAMTQEALRENEARFRALFEGSPLPIFVFEPETLRFLAANDACLRLYGYSRDELTALTLSDLRVEGETQLQEHLAGPAWKGSSRHKTRAGSILSVEINAREIPYGKRRARLATVQDVTKQEQLEAQLRQAQKMEAVGRLAGGVAHDFNNALSVILSYSEMLSDGLPREDAMRADLGEIGKAARRAADLTRQLLMFSRQQVLAPRVVDLNELLAGTERMLRRLLGEDVELALLPQRPLGSVRIDPGSIEQVIVNLAVNARDAMPTGGKLTLETADVTLDDAFAQDHLGVTPGPHVMLAVTDTGVGMDRATQSRIFEPFFTTKDKTKGTGLGLSTVFGIVQQSGGTVWVYSEPGRGTTFKVYLPRVEGPAESILPTAPPATLRGSETVLLVEDDDQVRAVAGGILRRHGYRVIEAHEGGEALRLAGEHAGTIRLLLTDVVMPGMSGTELARQLAQKCPAMRVLFMSGYTDDSIVRHGVLEASMAFLQKPFTPEVLTRRVREVLDG
jgi:hypothetical protein